MYWEYVDDPGSELPSYFNHDARHDDSNDTEDSHVKVKLVIVVLL